MADRRDYFFKQLVTESEMDQGFDGLEDADRSIVKETGIWGITAALVSENSPTADLTVNVQDLFSFDKDGQRVVAEGVNNVDLALDFASNPTTVATPGNEKILSLFVEFDRALSDPRLDGNNDTVFFVRDETFNFIVKQGAESVPPATAPPVEADKLLVADITLSHSQTQILDANISTSRQERLVVDTALGDTVKEAIENLSGTTSINLLRGMNETYRRQSTDPGGNADTPGDGATILRDGQAVTVQMPNTADQLSNRPPDPWNAAFIVTPTDFTKTGDDATSGGDVGILGFTGFRETNDANELSSGNSLSAMLASFIPRDIQASTLSGTTVRTRIAKGASATLNPTGGGSTSLIRLTGDDYFALANGRTAIRRQDVMLVTFADNTQQAYRLRWFSGGAEKDAELETMGRGTPVFPTDTLVTVQWFSALFELGSYPWETGDNESFSMGYYAPARLRDGGSSINDLRGPRFMGRSFYLPNDPPTAETVMQFGYTDSVSDEFFPLQIRADGSILSLILGTGQYTSQSTGRLQHALGHRFLAGSGGPSDETFLIDPANVEYDGSPGSNGAGYSAIAFSPGGAPDTPIEVTIDTNIGDLENGMLIEFIYNHSSGLDVTMVWDAAFRFSDPSDAQLGALNGLVGQGAMIRWQGIVYGSTILMKRTDYP